MRLWELWCWTFLDSFPSGMKLQAVDFGDKGQRAWGQESGVAVQHYHGRVLSWSESFVAGGLYW